MYTLLFNLYLPVDGVQAVFFFVQLEWLVTKFFLLVPVSNSFNDLYQSRE